LNPRLERRLSGDWRPASEADAEALGKYKAGAIVEFYKVRRRRNGKQHQKMFVLFDLVFANQDRYPTREAMINDIKLKCGHFESHINYYKRPGDTEWSQRVMQWPKSVDYDSLDKEAFEQFYDRAMLVVLDCFFPEMKRAGLENELINWESNWKA